ncbi:MAG: hypothetical protein ABI614_01630 [Planctomycetota bacterium]
MPEVPLTLELGTFSKHLGDEFHIQLSGQVRAVKLIEAEAAESQGAAPAQSAKSFSLLFHDRAATVRSFVLQGIYRFDHPELGTLELFMVPVGPDKQGQGICYQVIFNSSDNDL